MVKVLLFDFDGTIADSFENFVEIVNKQMAKYKLPIVLPDEIEALRLEDAKTVLKRFKIPFYKLPFFVRGLKRMQREHITGLEAFEGLPEVLQSLKRRGYTLGIVSSNDEENVRMFLEHNKMDVFDFVYGDARMLGKDRVIKHCLRRHKIDKKDVVYVGDEIRDIEACRSVGIKVASVTWGFNSKEGLMHYNPDFLVDSPSELGELFTRKGV